MINKYSDIRKELNFHQIKSFDDDLAYLTHYWQSFGRKYGICFLQEAQDFLDQVSEPVTNYIIPFDYDVPFPPNNNYDFKFIDLFAGIGGFRIALQELKGKCVFSSEWDRHAKKTYEANFGEIPFGDITKIEASKIPNHDILTGGFPCQPFSIAGVSKKNALGKDHGFLDKTQGTLFFDIARIIKSKRPKAFLLENVKNLRSHDKGKTFLIILETLEKLGYRVFSKVLDAKNYVPQHRERIFIVGFSEAVFGKNISFSFPSPPLTKQSIASILEQNPDKRYTLSDKLWNYLQEYAKKHRAKGNGFGFGLTDLSGISRTLSARYYKDGSEILIPRGKGKNPRRLTPEECKRLMGFPEKFLINNIGVSDTQLYKQFGNSVAVPVVRAVASELMKVFRQNQKGQMQSSA